MAGEMKTGGPLVPREKSGGALDVVAPSQTRAWGKGALVGGGAVYLVMSFGFWPVVLVGAGAYAAKKWFFRKKRP